MLMAGTASLTQLPDFALGAIRVSPARRVLEGEQGPVTVEPLVMKLLVELSRNAGRVVTRRTIFDLCWGASSVGDDSLNRIVAALRKALDEAGEGLVTVETVPRTGYLLRLHDAPGAEPTGAGLHSVQRAVDDGLASIWHGLPQPDNLRLEALRRAVQAEPDNAAAWGMLALLARYAAEYAEPPENSEYVAECQASAARALALDPSEATAKVALATIAPLFGRWHDARRRLGAVAQDMPDCQVAVHEFAITEMATGRVRAARTLIDGLIEQIPVAACLHYKSAYQNWSDGNLVRMDHVADQAVQLWPTHPAVWTARFWTLAFTDRVQAALRMLDDAVRPQIPAPFLGFYRAVATARASGDPAALEQAAAASFEMAGGGPGRAIAALFALGLLDRPREQLAVASAYYLREGPSPVPVRRIEGEPSINDQHRRVTQILFTPAFAEAREHPEFMRLCDRIGLSDYWQSTGSTPDFLRRPGE